MHRVFFEAHILKLNAGAQLLLLSLLKNVSVRGRRPSPEQICIGYPGLIHAGPGWYSPPRVLTFYGRLTIQKLIISLVCHEDTIASIVAVIIR